MPTGWKIVQRWISRFQSDTRGGILILVAFALLPLMGALAVASDAARGFAAREKLQRALDIAALAAAQKIGDQAAVQAEITNYFKANFPDGFMSASVDGPYFTIDAETRTLTLTGSATIPTGFMRVLGKDEIEVAAQTEVTSSNAHIDIVVAIDMSGSMDWTTNGEKRVVSARNAATELVNTLFGEIATHENLYIGIVPWNGKVNVMRNGASYVPGSGTSEAVPTFDSTPTWLNPAGGAQSTVYYANNSPVPLMSTPSSSWQGCVYARYVNDGIDSNDADILRGSLDSGSGDWRAWEPVGSEGEPVSGSAECAMAPYWTDCTACLNYGITALTNVKQDVLDAINELQSPDGGTNIPQGLGWAWHVLMPDAPFAEAIPDEDVEGNRIRAVVLLTDGENDAHYGDGYKATWGNNSSANGEMDDRLRLLATNMKNDDVVIYTIQFANGSGDLADLMKSVATTNAAPHYHFAPDGDTLSAIFNQVATHLSELRISK